MDQTKKATIEGYLKKGHNALKAEEWDSASGYFEEVLTHDRSNQEARKGLQEVRIGRARSWGPLKRLLTKIKIKLDMQLKKYALAWENTLLLYKSHPNKVGAARDYGYCSARLGKLDEACQAYEQAKRLSPRKPKVLHDLAGLYTTLGRHNDAAKIYRQLQQMYPKDHEIASALQNAVAMGFTQEAIPEETITDRRAEMDKQQLEAGSQEAKEKRLEEMIKKCTEEPGNIEARLELALALAQANYLEKAVDVLQGVLKIKPGMEKALLSLAKMQLQQKDFAAAVLSYERLKDVIGHDPELEDTIWDTKIKQQEAILAVKPEDTLAQSRLRQLQDARLEARISALVEEERKSPGKADVCLKLGNAYRQRGEVDLAVGEFQKAARSPQYFFFASKGLGECFAEKGLDELAISQLKDAMERKPPGRTGVLIPEVKEVLYMLGSLYEKTGEIEKARETWRALYQEDISFRDIKEKFEGLYGRSSPQPSGDDNPQPSA